MSSILCGNCHKHHSTIWEVRDCYGLVTASTTPAPPAPPQPYTGPAWRAKEVSPKQIFKVESLGGDPAHAKTLTRGECSDYIERLIKNPPAKAAPVATPAPAPVPEPAPDPYHTAPNRIKTKIPMEFITAVPNGYYASRPDSDREYTFFRVSRPKSGKYKGALKIQTQHGPDYKLFMVIWPSGAVSIYNTVAEDDFLLVTVDPNGCGMAYAEKIGRCMRCNTELTDPRSRWYGIGPECEKYWPHMIGIVDETKGPFQYGSDS